jgi:heme-degrading monooxygenase HmoA
MGRAPARPVRQHAQVDPPADESVITIFRSRLRPGVAAEYGPLAARMLSLAREMPGFVDFKTYEAEDGERVSIVVFDSPGAQRAWRQHPEHLEAQRRGREELYESYTIEVCRRVGPARTL